MSKCQYGYDDRDIPFKKGTCKLCHEHHNVDRVESMVSEYPILKEYFNEEYFSKLRKQFPLPDQLGRSCRFSGFPYIFYCLRERWTSSLAEILTDFSNRFPEFTISEKVGHLKADSESNSGVFEFLLYDYLRGDPSFVPKSGKGPDGRLDLPNGPIFIEIKLKGITKRTEEIDSIKRRSYDQGEAYILNLDVDDGNISLERILRDANSQLPSNQKNLVICGIRWDHRDEECFLETIDKSKIKNIFNAFPEIGALSFLGERFLEIEPVKMWVNTSHSFPLSDDDIQRLIELLRFPNPSEALVKI